MRQYSKLPWLMAICAVVSSAADTVVFRTGERLRGVIVGETAASVVFDSAALGRIEISRDRVSSVEHDLATSPMPGVRPPAGSSESPTNHPGRIDFLRVYNSRGVRYEIVQPVRVVDPFNPASNRLSESIEIRGRLGIKASFDAADYVSGHGEKEVGANAEVRAFRFYTAGEFGVLRTNEFKLDLGFAGGNLYLHDASLRYPRLPFVGNLTLGYFAVPQTIENDLSFGGDSFMESASPALAFGPGHRIGVQLDRGFLNERMTASIGIFSVGQKASLNFGDASDALARPTLRVTGLVLDQPDRQRLLHLGASASFVFSDSSAIRYQARPESHLAPVLVDTGPLEARFAYVGGGEAIYQEGPFTLQSEILGSAVQANESLLFWGGYVSAGWLVSGKRATYDRRAGLPGKVRPVTPLSLRERGWGAFELAVRYSYLDLQDGDVKGGRMNILMPGLNWYWSENLRWQFNYGFAHVAEGRAPGNLNIFQARLQLIY